MLNKILIMLLNMKEKFWLKELDYLIFECDRTKERKESLLVLEDKLRSLVYLRGALKSQLVRNSKKE
ncbi:hypothetical protein [Clostridium sp.]|uniref:hypothetical protein n=1 Tax=Clostridium sp. TaxID=1506 RepID=UPI0026207FE6|nr:hypothetical protein [Clostridium sp.]